jgi:hypothetical protein
MAWRTAGKLCCGGGPLEAIGAKRTSRERVGRVVIIGGAPEGGSPQCAA